MSWIRMSKEKPEYAEKVLVWNRQTKGGYHFAQVKAGYIYFEGKDQEELDDDFLKDLYWMPLPTGPHGKLQCKRCNNMIGSGEILVPGEQVEYGPVCFPCMKLLPQIAKTHREARAVLAFSLHLEKRLQSLEAKK